MNLFNMAWRGSVESGAPSNDRERAMNHYPIRGLDAPAFPLNRRQLAKQRTRLKLLEAARALFAERGYDAATVRDIAAAADLSTGADLFNEVILADYEQVLGLVRREPDDGRPVKDRLLALLTHAYAAHLGQPRLVQAIMSFSWMRDIRADQRGARRVLDHLADMLLGGVDRGELPRQLDVCLTSEMVWDCYVSNYRRAIFDGWDLAALRERLASQIDILLCAHDQAV
jgi:AcrR family transcriptional regulator